MATELPPPISAVTGNVWSVRIGGGYRSLAVLDGDTFHWFWIGTHDEYERLLGLR